MGGSAAGTPEAPSQPWPDTGASQVTAARAFGALLLHSSVRTPAIGKLHVVGTGRYRVPPWRAAAPDASSLSGILAAGIAKAALKGFFRWRLLGFSAAAAHRPAEETGKTRGCRAWIRGSSKFHETAGTTIAFAGL